MGAANVRGALLDQLWNGEGERCPTFWPIEHLESQYRCELKVHSKRTAHFRSSDLV